MARTHTRLLRSALAALVVASAGGLAACDRLGGAASSGAAADLTAGQVRVLLDALADAPSHGFLPGAFGERGLAEHIDNGDRAARVQLRQAALVYAQALHGRAIPARALDPSWGVRPAAWTLR